MKFKKIFFLIAAVALIFLSVYFILSKEQDKSTASNNKKGPVPEWLQILPDHEFNNIENNDNKYSYQYADEVTDNGHVSRSIEYAKNNEEEYQGLIRLSFSSTENSFVETIPKSFASHVDQLKFSIEPARIINPDPIVEFTNISGELEIHSDETVRENELRLSMEEQLLDKESANCERLEGPEMYACVLRLISKYRHNESLKKQLADLNMAELLGAVSNAVQSGNLKKCDYIKDREQKNTCYEYGYQILVEECNSASAKEYRDCVREKSWQLPSIETRRLFCHHIDDTAMYNECRGTADMNICDEIENEDQKLICQLNIAKTISNIGACEKIQLPEGRDLCRAMLGIDKQDTRYCDLVKDDYFNGECNLKIAMAENDKTICANIKHQDSKDICYSYFSLIKNESDRAMCDDINEIFLKDMCELALAVKNKNIAKCESYTGEDESTKLLCYLAIAIKHNDSILCSKLITTKEKELLDIGKDMKDSCFAQIALNTENLELCDKIEKTSLKEECIDKLKKPATPRISCSDIGSPVCPLDNEAGRGATKHINQGGGIDVQCTYSNSKKAGYPLWNETFKLGKTKHGTYKQFYKSGNIQVSSEYIEGRTTGFRINCSDSGELTSCQMYDNGKALGSCMP